jgi:hypothetical protein
MTVVLDRADISPAAHALVIGVGAYSALPAEGGAPTADGWNLTQITSPPVSAQAFTRWLVDEYRNAAAPLGSVDLLLSTDAPAEFKSGANSATPIARATMENVKAAIETWYQRCDAHEQNLAIFYFCGHGVQSGIHTSLLTEDFGKNAMRRMADALDFTRFVAGMSKCVARRQCYVVDVCRTTPKQILEQLDDMGDRVVNADAGVVHAQDRDYAVVYATEAGRPAFGRPRETSRLTNALIRALRGAAHEDHLSGYWEVRSESLVRGINFVLEHEERVQPVPRQRAKLGGESSGFTLHLPEGLPIVPVRVGCRPAALTEKAVLEIARGGALLQSRPDGTAIDWDTDLPLAEYEFRARVASEATPRTKILPVRPPVREAGL